MIGTAAEAPLLATKLFVPPPRQNRVGRARLRDRLESVRGGTVTLAAAPAGSGKSTLLADWALTTGRRVAWLSLDRDDDDPRRFLNYVVAALRNAGIISQTNDIPIASSSTADALDAVVTELLNAIAELRAAAVLVLDDYHSIETDGVHRIVQSMIDHMPPNLHLVLATRVDPPLALSRLRARDMLLEMRAADLRFTEDEASRFLNDAMGLSLTPEEIAELGKRTEGWAVGLQMAAISLRGRSGTRNFISNFSGSNRYVLDYLTEEVLLRQPPEVRSFLVDTSVLTQLSSPLCDAVTGRNDSRSILEQLDAENLFLIPLDDVRFWYRYHHLFATLLQHELERSATPERVAELHRRAARWYDSESIPETALHHATAAGDDELAVAIVSRHAGSRIVAGDGASIVRWFTLLKKDRVEHDLDLLILHTRALTTEYELDHAMRSVLRAEEIVAAGGRDDYEGVVLSLKGMLERLTGNAAGGTATLERAMSMLDPNGFWYSMNSLHLGMVALMEPDLAKAETHLGRATAYRDQPDGLLTAVFGQAYGAWIALWRGDSDAAIERARESVRWVEEWDAKHHTGQQLTSLGLTVMADAFRLRNDLRAARDCAERAVEFGRAGFVIGFSEASRLLALVAQAEGDYDSAFANIHDALRAVRCSGNLDWLDSARSLEYELMWRRGKATGRRSDLEQVTAWCEQSGLLAAEDWRSKLQPGLCYDTALLVGVRVLIDQERFDEATLLLEALLRDSSERERVPAEVTLLILRAITAAASGDLPFAIDTMTRALDRASAPRFIRPFLDSGAEVVPILERAAARAKDRDFATRVLSAFEVPVKQRSSSPELRDALSDREVEVLKLIAGGATNQEAARKLFVAPSTVKKHLENIYAKLAVGGRTQAIARARELRIL